MGTATQTAQRTPAVQGGPRGGAGAGTVILGREWPVLSPRQQQTGWPSILQAQGAGVGGCAGAGRRGRHWPPRRGRAERPRGPARTSGAAAGPAGVAAPSAPFPGASQSSPGACGPVSACSGTRRRRSPGAAPRPETALPCSGRGRGSFCRRPLLPRTHLLLPRPALPPPPACGPQGTSQHVQQSRWSPRTWPYERPSGSLELPGAQVPLAGSPY